VLRVTLDLQDLEALEDHKDPLEILDLQVQQALLDLQELLEKEELKDPQDVQVLLED
jgi:hypothetical protein